MLPDRKLGNLTACARVQHSSPQTPQRHHPRTRIHMRNQYGHPGHIPLQVINNKSKPNIAITKKSQNTARELTNTPLKLGTRERKKRIPGNGPSSNVILSKSNGPPPIPEPDYSCSESDVESEEEQKEMGKLASRLSAVQLHPVENSGNSNTR